LILTEEKLLAIFHVAASRLQQFFGGGFLMTDDLPYASSGMGARLIVAAEHETFSSPDEAIRPN
jgi:hypothetical protein